jgi:hypothetical protein
VIFFIFRHTVADPMLQVMSAGSLAPAFTPARAPVDTRLRSTVCSGPSLAPNGGNGPSVLDNDFQPEHDNAHADGLAV